MSHAVQREVEDLIVTIDSCHVLSRFQGSLAQGGRGMELSELVVFDGKLLSFDDRTGVVYQIEGDKVSSPGRPHMYMAQYWRRRSQTGIHLHYILDCLTSDPFKVLPWVLLNDGDGHATKGFKSEWATVKDGLLYVGGLGERHLPHSLALQKSRISTTPRSSLTSISGKEWTNSKGAVLSFDPQWIKVITPGGRVVHRDWRDNYLKLCSAANIEPPGYMIHEAVNWSPVHQQWFFLPRRASHEAYDDAKDEHRGTNILLRSSQDFKKISLQNVGPKIESHGFSSFKFIPGDPSRPHNPFC